MTADLIVGTAGHIDHGKTSLVRSLTGVDCDRLPEEKARGMTIDLGFAQLALDEFRLGIVDVPGHERFVRNMLAGASGVDIAILVVAADDSVMPQTREHLEILRLLGVEQGVVALTKVDLVDDTTREMAELEISEATRGTFLERAPIVPVDNRSGAGLAELKAALLGACRQFLRRHGEPWFRLAIDRAFVAQGHGVVVTGTVSSGSVRIGDELDWLPRGERARVRSIQNHGAAVEVASRGTRAAINLAGIARQDVSRGQELAHPGYLAPSRVMTVDLRCLASARQPIKHRAPVRLHLGSAEIMASVSLFDRARLGPGEHGLAHLFLTTPAVATWGQPFVLRDSSAQSTVGGGLILQPLGRKSRRSRLRVKARLLELQSPDAITRADAALWLAGFGGLEPNSLPRLTGIGSPDIDPTLAELERRGKLLAIRLSTSRAILIHQERWAELTERVIGTLEGMHREHPLSPWLDRSRVAVLAGFPDHAELVLAAIDSLVQEGRIRGDSRRLRLAGFAPPLTPAQISLKARIAKTYLTSRFLPPKPTDFGDAPAATVSDLISTLVAEGLLVHIQDELFLHADVERELRSSARQALAQGKSMAVADFRDLWSTSRRAAVPLCEYLDEQGITRRVGDQRVLARSPA